MVRFGKNLVDVAKVQEAVDFYFGTTTTHKNGGIERPSLETIKKNFRFISSASHLEKLREFQRLGDLHFISKELLKVVRKLINCGNLPHSRDLQNMEHKIRKDHEIQANFKFCLGWINHWKRANRISS